MVFLPANFMSASTFIGLSSSVFSHDPHRTSSAWTSSRSILLVERLSLTILKGRLAWRSLLRGSQSRFRLKVASSHGEAMFGGGRVGRCIMSATAGFGCIAGDSAKSRRRLEIQCCLLTWLLLWPCCALVCSYTLLFLLLFYFFRTVLNMCCR